MRAEKGGSKSSGFFNLFDWNRKSRKKLFTISPEGSKIGRRIEEPILPSCLRMMDEEEAMAISSIKGSSDYSCASSINSDDLNGSKPAGVVARLMGLDSLPVSALSDLNSTPFNSFRDPIINNNNNYNINNYNNNNNYARKMPSSPIERFQMEALPSNRSVKSLPNNYHNKLLSPIKNPNFVYGRNASQIMEAAAKIIESSNNNNNISSSSNSNMREKVCLTGRVNGLRVDPLRSDKGSSRLLRMSRGFERGLNREEDIVIIRSSSPDSYEGNNNINNSNNINLGGSNNNSGLSGRGNKGKSVSLAIQAKVNVQKREGVNLSTRNYGSVHRESGSGNSNGTSSQRTGTIKQQKKGSTGTGSSSPVLRQNNQKQNCIGNRAGKSGSGKSTQSQQARKSETLNSTRQKSRLSSNLKPRKENFEISNSNESGKDFPQKKRLIDRTNNSTNNNNNNINNNNNNNNNNVNVNTKGKNSVLVDEYTKFNKETKDTTDVVSFTFTSPLLKQTGDSSFASQKLGLVTKGNKDALSLLLENKLRELTNKTNEKLIDFGNSDLGFDLRGKEIERNLGFEFEFEEREKDGVFDFSNDQSFRVMEKGECSKKNDIYEYEENKQLSPFSVFGEESCSTSESSNSIDGSKVSPSSVQAQNTSASSRNFLSSPSQLDTSSTKLFQVSKFNNPELDYVTDIISNTDLENMFLEGAQLDSPFFDKLERKRSRTELENDDSSSSSLSLNDRRLLYDCVKECLGNKLEVNFLNKGIFSKGEGIFPMNKEVYGQIEGWRKMRDLDVDEVVERDMVVKKDYTADSIMICTDLEAEILDSLIEGLVGELM